MAAAGQWPEQGTPDDPKAWLITVASRRLTDELRSEDARRRREERAHRGTPGRPDDARRTTSRAVADQRRHAHGAVPLLPPGAVAPVAARAHPARRRRAHHGRDRRARSSCPSRPWPSASAGPSRRIKAAGARFELPHAAELAERLTRRAPRALPDVQRGLHGHVRATRCNAPTSPPRRSASPARSTRLLPDEDEVAGLLALMLLTDARRAARTDRRTAPSSRWPSRIAAGGTATPSPRASTLITRTLPDGSGRAVPAPGRHRRRPRRGADRRGHRLAPDPGAVRRARAGRSEPDGHAQPSGRRRHDRRTRRRRWQSSTTLDERPAPRRPPPPPRRAGPPPRAGRPRRPRPPPSTSKPPV